MPRFRPLIAGLCAIFLCSCIQTQMQGYADREQPAQRIGRVVAYVSAPLSVANEIQASIAREGAKRGIAAEDALQMFPPTRTYTAQEVRRDLAVHGIDAVLVLKVGDSGVISQYAGTIFTGQANGSYSAVGNVTNLGNVANVSMTGTSTVTSSAVATPVYRYRRSTDFVAQLFDTKTGRMLWTGHGNVAASGALFVGSGVSAHSAVSAIFDDLQSKGVIAAAAS